MLRYLILMTMLILGACGEKKTSAQNNEIIEEKIDPDVVISEAKDKGELILVNQRFLNWVHDKIIESQGEWEGFDPPSYRGGIYWDPSKDLYYQVRLKSVNEKDLPFQVTNFSQDLILHKATREIFSNTGAPFLYVGQKEIDEVYIHRYYYDPTNQLYYVKKLRVIDMDGYIYSYASETSDDSSWATNFTPMTLYPFIDYNEYRNKTTAYYTNIKGEFFCAPSWGNHFSLRSSPLHPDY
ncbi:MAG: hypothetical protein ACRCS8_00125 [Brevinema sp.]